uniref:(California timema) hypothetical protein n=1 Tax=Timema californicum TaxID=61474 RepID=A0A7R9P3L4_TIMCA|nr:unnamed protein product [Timema californicum]
MKGTPNDVYSNFEDIFEPKQNFQSFRASIQHNQPRNSYWTSHNGDRPKINHNSSSNYTTENFRKQNESNTTIVSPFCSENQNTKLLQIKDSLHVTKNSKPAKIISQPRVILGTIDQNKFYLTKDSSFPPNEKFKIVQENIITGQFVPSIKPQEIYESSDIENNYQSKVDNKYSTEYFYDLEEFQSKPRNRLNTSGESVYSKDNRLFHNDGLLEDEYIDLFTYCSPKQSQRTESFQDLQTSGTDRLMESQPLFNQLKGATDKQESHDSNLSDVIDFQFLSPSGKYQIEMISHRNTALQIPVPSTSKHKYKMALQPHIDSKDGKTNSQHSYKPKTVRSSGHGKCLSVYNDTDLCNDVLPIENMPQSIKTNPKLLDIAPVNKIQPSTIKNIQTNISNVCYNESLKQEKPGFFNNNESSNQESDEESNNIWDDIAWFDVLNTKLKNFQKQYSISDSLNSSDASFITNQADNESCVKNKHDSCDEHIIDYNNDLSNDSISFSDICDQHSFFDGGKVNSSCDEQKFNSPRSMVQVCPESINDVQMLNSQTSQFINTDKISNSNAQFDKVSEDDFSWLDEILFTGTPDKHIYTDSHKHKNEKSSPESKNLRNNILVTKTSPSIEESSDILISQETKQIVCGKNKQEIKNNPKIKQKIFQTKTANDNTQVTVSFMNPFLPKLTRKRSNKKMNTINKPCDALRKEHVVYEDNKDNKSEVTIGSANITISAEKITKLDMSKPRMSLTCRKTRKLLKKASTFKSPLIQTTLHFNKVGETFG